MFLSRLARFITLKAFFKDKRGVSAVEFAFVAPILIVAYLGLAELTQGMMASRRAAHLAATVGDLASQSDNLTAANVTDLFAIGTSLMLPFDTSGTTVKIRLTCVVMQSSGQATVLWSNQQNWAAYTKNAVISSITTSQITTGQSLIMTEVEYDYTSPVGNLLPGQTKFTDTFYHNPRNGQVVTNTG